MKIVQLLLLCLPLGLFAQQWAPVSATETQHFRLSDSAFITHSIRVDSVKNQGNDVVFYLNRVFQQHDWELALYRQGQFLGQTITQKPDGQWIIDSENLFFDTSIVILPAAPLGATWLAVADAGVTATVTEIVEGTVLGLPDSLKTIAFSNGAKWVLSKNNGIWSAPDFTNGNLTATLSGLENQGIGDRLYHFSDFFGYNVGDVFESHTFRASLFGETEILLKMKILDKTIHPNGFDYFVENRRKTVMIGAGNSTTYAIDSTHVQYLEQDFPHLSAYPNQAVNIPADAGFWGQFTFVKHLENGIRLGSPGEEDCAVSSLPNDPNDWIFFIENALGCHYGHFYEEYHPHIGRVTQSASYIDNIHYTQLLGAVVQGDTIWGKMSPDWFFTGTNSLENVQKLTISPNPTQGWVAVDIPTEAQDGWLQVFDMTGTRLQNRSLPTQDIARLDLSALPEGAYQVMLRCGQKIWQSRVLKTGR